jgi:glycerol-3-phosphate acyltransferase PlsY
MNWLYLVLCAVIGYLLGSLSTGVVIARLFGNVDIRKQGSGNIGMTNVMRTLGWLPSILTFLGDALKGVAAALIGRAIGGEVGLHIGGAAAVIGHNWPVLFGFKGGKGMSTSLGYLIAADWRIALLLLVAQVIIVLITGYMSLASITTAIALPIVVLILHINSQGFIICAVLLGALALYSHRENIKRLISGRENMLSAKKISDVSRKVMDKLKRGKNKGDGKISDRT